MRALPKPSVVAILVMAAVLSLWKLTSATAQQAEEARGILMEAAAAMGELDALQALRSQVVVSRGSSYEPEQAVRPDGEARHVADFEYTLTRDIAGEKLRIMWKRESFYPFSHTWQFTEVIDGVVGWVEGQDGYRSPSQQHVMSAARIATRWRAEIEAITEPKTITDGQRRVEVYPVECSHVEGMLMVYLPQEKILFQSDLFVSGSPLPLQAGARELLRAIQQRQLQVEQLAGGHGPVGSFEELRKAAGELM